MLWFSPSRTELQKAVISLDPGKVKAILDKLDEEDKAEEVCEHYNGKFPTITLLIKNTDKCVGGNETDKVKIFDLLIPYVNLRSIEGMLKTLIAHPDCVSDLFKTKVKNWIASQYWGSKLWIITDDKMSEYYKEANLKTPGNNILKAKRDSLYNELSRDIQTQRARVRQKGPPPPDPMQAKRNEYEMKILYNQFSRKRGGKRKTKKLRKRKTLLKKTNSSRF